VRAVLVSLASTHGGCSVAPAYERPASPVATVFPGQVGVAAGDGATLAAGLGWREYFADAELRGVIAAALENNRDVRMATARIAEARAVYGIRRADQLPTVNAGAAGARSRTPADLSPTERALTSSQYQATLGVTAWEVDLWGRVRDLRDAALEEYLATEEARRAVRITLVSQVADAYLVVCEIEERLALTRRTIATREESARIARRRYEVGSVSKIDPTQAQTILGQARAELAVLERQRELARNALVLLVGTPVESGRSSLAASESGMVSGLAPGLPSEVLVLRPDVLAAEHRLMGATVSIGAARAAFFPRIVLTGDLGVASVGLDSLFSASGRVWTFGPSISVPLFDGGRNASNLDLAVARQTIALAQYERTVQVAFREVADALAGRRWLTEQVSLQREVLSWQTERSRLAELRYRQGAAPYLEVLDAQRDLFAAEQALVQARRQLLSAGVALYAALGGGDLETTP
jgi:outer membrane protein, multidrug efflux system